MAVVLYLVQPDYMKVLFQNSIGIMAVIISAVMAVIGYFWLRRTLAIEV
jgi:Flp pilus assembly protein TadB